MKLKKVKKLLGAINALCKRPYESIKGIINTGAMLDDKHPLVLLPTRGKYLLPEIREINKVVMSIDVTKLLETAVKVNAQTGMNIMSVLKDPKNAYSYLVLIHTPYGCCMYSAYIEDTDFVPEGMEVKNIDVDLDDNDIRDKYQIM